MEDCLVVGGGIIGMLTARQLRREGAEVTLLERGEVGREASWAAGGILSPLYPWRVPDPVTRLSGWSQAVYGHLANELNRETGIDPRWAESGLMVLDTEEAAAAFDWAEQAGVSIESVDRDTLSRLEPALANTFQRALRMPKVAQLRPPRLMRALRQSLLLAKVRIEEQTEVARLLTRKDRIIGVETSHGTYRAGRVVVASGAWSAQLLKELVIKLEVRPIRGQMILLQAGPGLSSHIILHRNRYTIPRRDDLIVVGSTVEDVGFDKSTTEEALRELYQSAVELIPALEASVIRHSWAGLRPGSPTGVPFVGEHPGIKGLYLNTGHFRNGITLAPASAQLLVDLMLDRSSIVDPAPYLHGL